MSGDGGSPGTYTSTGITVSTPPSVSGMVSMPPPHALLPIAITALGAGIAAMVTRSGPSIAVVTAPVTMRMSACRGDAVKKNPSRWRS